MHVAPLVYRQQFLRIRLAVKVYPGKVAVYADRVVADPCVRVVLVAGDISVDGPVPPGYGVRAGGVAHRYGHVPARRVHPPGGDERHFIRLRRRLPDPRRQHQGGSKYHQQRGQDAHPAVADPAAHGVVPAVAKCHVVATRSR